MAGIYNSSKMNENLEVSILKMLVMSVTVMQNLSKQETIENQRFIFNVDSFFFFIMLTFFLKNTSKNQAL